MKTKILWAILVLVACFLALPEVAKAVGPGIVSGRWAGVAFANPAIDFNGDGISARTFDVKTYDEVPFAGLEGTTDSGLVSIGTCAGPGSLELKAYGKFTFRGRLGDGLYAEVDSSAPNLCFDPANPSEVATIRIVGGTGIYAHATGMGTLTLHDVVRLDTLVSVPGLGSIPVPLMIDTRGEFTLHVNL